MRIFLICCCISFAVQAQVSLDWNPDTQTASFSEKDRAVLVYHQGSTPLPEGIPEEESEHGDYISRICGLHGEALLEDYPADHPHHRGVNWAWAAIQWKGESRDMFWGKGAFARPETMKNAASGNPAVLTVENSWKWDDVTPILRETATILVYPESDRGRNIDFDLRFLPLVEGLEFCGRLDAGYSGFNIRMAPAAGQEIVFQPEEKTSRNGAVWADYTALFSGKQRSGLAILQHPDNPGHPQAWRKYPPLNFFQPVWPGGKPIPMPEGREIRLRYRLVIHDSGTDPERLKAAWKAYAAKE